ncbi:MAG: hypothetical protein QOH91_3167 [Mycobacterium sp.]|jgi:hypothetical protein|nr:hypothetical protein [Mycobacterium sp.]
MVGQTEDVRRVADMALAAATSNDDALTGLLAEVALALANCADGYAGRTAESLERLGNLIRETDPGALQHFAAVNRAILLVTLGPLDEAATSVSEGLRLARAQRNSDGGSAGHPIAGVDPSGRGSVAHGASRKNTNRRRADRTAIRRSIAGGG